MADCAFTLTREEQIAYIKIESRRGKGPPQILNSLEEVVPTTVLAYSTIRRWVPLATDHISVLETQGNKLVAQNF